MIKAFQELLTQWSIHIFVTVSLIVAWECLQTRDLQRLLRQLALSTKDENEGKEELNHQLRQGRFLDQLKDDQRDETLKRKIVEENKVPKESKQEQLQGDQKDATLKKNMVEDKKVSRESKQGSTKSSNTSGNSSIIKSPPPIKATTNDHPGMAAFNYWYDIEASLFRIYTFGRKDKVPVAPPYVPHSFRGKVSIYLHVTNHTSVPIKVFWVDYSGKSIFKGDLPPNRVWTQTTYIDHPWIFEHAVTQEVLLYYIPYRVIPTSSKANTVSEDGSGQHKFALVDPTNRNGPFWIGVKDDILPYPGIETFTTPLLGITWTLKNMSRFLSPEDPVIETFQKYLKNIIEKPEILKYRQIRIRAKSFTPIWTSTMKGLLLAIGFVEREGFVELGCTQALSRERIQEVALLSYLVNKWKLEQKRTSILEQPEGADGFGRQGFGRAGQMS